MSLVGLMGFQHSSWRSLSRTARHYLNAIVRLGVEVCIVGPDGLAMDGRRPDAAFVFDGKALWGNRPDCPVALALHGGAVVDCSGLAARASELRTTDILIANCSGDIEILDQLFDKNFRPAWSILRLPVGSPFSDPPDRSTARRDLQMPDCEFVIGYVGRLIPQRNLHRNLSLAEKLRGSGVDAKVVAVGENWSDYPVLPYERDYAGFLSETFDQMISDGHVHFYSGLDDTQLATVYSGCDVLLHLSTVVDENFGYTAVEAMACGTPVVATAYGGLRDTVLDRLTGLLIPTWITAGGIRFHSGDAEGAIKAVLSGQAYRRRMGLAGRRHATKNFSQDQFTAGVRALARQALSAQSLPWESCKSQDIAPPFETSALPITNPDWMDYAAPTKLYASLDAPPPVELGSEIALFAPAAITDTGLRFDDPAWPASYDLTPLEARIVEVLLRDADNPIAISKVAGLLGEQITSTAQRLVDRGVITTSLAKS